MERLTYRVKGYTQTDYSTWMVEEKLAAYEDTGLTPERCAELAKAEREGRLMEMPCKTGTPVYCLLDNSYRRGRNNVGMYEAEGFGLANGKQYIFDGDEWEELGKTVFLTRQEAEKAPESEA